MTGQQANRLLEAARRLLGGQMPRPGLLPQWLVDGVAVVGSVRRRISRLTPMERLLTTLRHREPDRVPVAPLLGGVCRQLVGASFAEFSVQPDLALEAGLLAWQLVGGDVLLLGLDLSVEASDFGQPTLYPEDSTAHPDYARPLLTDWSDYRKLKPIALATATRMQRVLQVARLASQRVGTQAALAAVVSGPLTVLGMLRGTERLFKDCVQHPQEVMAAEETVTTVLVDYVDALCEAGVIVIALDMLYASRSGLGRRLWEKVEGPFATVLADRVRQHRCVVGVHNCGDGPDFEAMIRSMQPEAISFATLPDDCANRRELKRRYGDQTVLVGYVDTGLLHHGSPRAVLQACREMIDELADGGGFVLAPGCEYPPNCSLVNALALVRAAELYG